MDEKEMSALKSAETFYFFCAAVNLLELEDLKSVMQEIEPEKELCSLPAKERAAYMKKRLENIADERQIVWKLRKKR